MWSGLRFFEVVALLLISWVVMCFTHEVGHLIGGWISGATLSQVDLVPWRLPYSIHEPDPNPLVTLWMGPIIGAFLPWCIGIVIRQQWIRLVGNFCLLANGLYIGVGYFLSDRYLDTQRLITEGTSTLTISSYCLVTLGIGYPLFRSSLVEVWKHGLESIKPLAGRGPNND